MGTIIPVDFGADQRPKYLVLESAIRAAVAEGRLPPGAQLPPVRKLAWEAGVTPGTVARVYRSLTEAGVLDAAVGRGTFVASGPRPAPMMAPYLTEAYLPEQINLRTSQVPDVGQNARIQNVQKSHNINPEDHYTNYPTRGTDAPLRAALAQWFQYGGADPIDPDDVVLTLGAQHAMVVLFQALLRGPRPVILTEDLAYPGFRHAAGLVRAEIKGVPFDDQGLLPDALDRICAETGAQVLCTCSEAHNPTTIRTSPARRAEIVSVIERYNIELIDDDCFACSESQPSYRRLAPSRAWRVTSMSKTISPALRLGMIISPHGRATQALLAAQHQFFGLPRPQTDLIEALIASGEADAIRRDVLQAQADRVAMATEILAGYDFRARHDSPFIWLKMPRGWRASSFLRAAEAEGIRLKASDEFALIDGHAPNAVRLALNGERDDAIFAAALSRLAAILANPPAEVDV